MITTYFLGVHLRELRKRIGLTQEGLAGQLGLSRAAISQFESGISRPSLDTLTKLSSIFGEDLTEAFKSVESANERRKQRAAARELVVKIDFEQLYVDLPFVESDKSQIFVDFYQALNQALPEDLEWIWVRREDNTSYDDAVIWEVSGSKMAPRYPENSRYVIRVVNQDKWPYSSGVHLIVFKNGLSFLRRIVSNGDGTIQLISDNGGERIDAFLKDVNYMWKVGECIFMPAED